MNMNSRVTSLVSLALIAAFLGGCGGDGDNTNAAHAGDQTPSPSAPSTRTETGLADVPLPVAAGADVDGLVEVAGHRLAVHCTGSGHPTVVILHGWIDQPGVSSHYYYGALTANLEGDFRVCDYDRANVGDSETVPGPQTPERVVGDLDELMEALGDHGPYVLVGQSAGGMVASAYAVAHPDKVAGIVMVDADFDDEITLEENGIVPAGLGACSPANRKADGQDSLQRIDNCAIYRWAYQRRALRPKVPLVYLAAKQAPWSNETEIGPAYTKAIIPLQKAYAASWWPGKFMWVDSGHEIHNEKPGVVGDAVRWVVKEGTR
jgi:pimeloyl-ACP methyl ester carboxylesterase